MGLRKKYESIRATLLHRSPLPSLDATMQEILFEENRLGINPSKQSDVVLASTSPLNGASNTFCKNCKFSGHKFINCPKIKCKYYHKRGPILDNYSTRLPQPPGSFTKAKNFTKPGTPSIVVATSDDSTSPHLQISDLQNLLNQLILSPFFALVVSPGN